MNGFLYEYVALVLQASQAYNVTIPGGRKYNVPSGNITIDNTVDTSSPNRTSYSPVAIAGADDYNDGNTTIKDVFDIIVENTREVTPACTFFTIGSHSFILLTFPQSSWNRVDTRVCTKRTVSNQYFLTRVSPGIIRMDGLSVRLSGLPRTALSNSNTLFLSSETLFVYSML